MDFTRSLIFFRALGLTVFVFGLLLWGYSVMIQITHPEWIAAGLTHHAFPPLNWRVDDTGIIGFAAAPLGFLVWILSHNMHAIARRGKS